VKIFLHHLPCRDTKNIHLLKKKNKYFENIWPNFDKTIIAMDGEE
jgi:hypothetical protein